MSSLALAMERCHWMLSAPTLYILLAAVAAALLVGGGLLATWSSSKASAQSSALATYVRFFYASFLKPHTGDGADTGQQAALESFYKAQVSCCSSLESHSLPMFDARYGICDFYE